MSVGPDAARAVGALARSIAWDVFADHVSCNESHLASYVEGYEDETDREVRIPRGRRNERGAELLDPRFEAWCRERVEGEAAEFGEGLGRRFAEGRVRCWRALLAPADWVPSGPNCGIHWTYDPGQAIAHFGDGAEGVVHVVEAEVPFASIDWDATVRANLSEEFREECEVTLLPEGAVEVVGVSMRAVPAAEGGGRRPA